MIWKYVEKSGKCKLFSTCFTLRPLSALFSGMFPCYLRELKTNTREASLVEGILNNKAAQHRCDINS